VALSDVFIFHPIEPILAELNSLEFRIGLKRASPSDHEINDPAPLDLGEIRKRSCSPNLVKHRIALPAFAGRDRNEVLGEDIKRRSQDFSPLDASFKGGTPCSGDID
jgi:hypothetical protein